MHLDTQKSEKKVAIIGAGIAGLSLAYFLQKRGLRVTLFDREEPKNASVCSQGVITVKGLRIAEKAIFDAKLKGPSVLLEILNDVQSNVDGVGELFRFGVIEPYSELKDFQKTASRIYRREFLGAYDVTISKHAENSLLEGSQRDAMASNSVGGLYYPKDFNFNTQKFLPALKSLLQARGAKFFNLDIKNIEVLQNNRESNEYFSIDKQDFDTVFLACSIGINPLLNTLGLNQVKMKQKAGVTLEISDASMKWAGIKSGVMSINFVNKVRVGSFDFELPDSGDLTPEILEAGSEALTDFYHAHLGTSLLSKDFQVKPYWGVRVTGPGRMPIMGTASSGHDVFKHLWIFSGFYKSGYSLAPYFAQMIAEHLCGKIDVFTHKLFSDCVLDKP